MRAVNASKPASFAASRPDPRGQAAAQGGRIRPPTLACLGGPATTHAVAAMARGYLWPYASRHGMIDSVDGEGARCQR